jgi:hypothetical protein
MARTPRIDASIAADVSPSAAARAARAYLRDEHQRAGVLIEDGLRRGPLTSYHRVVTGRVDAPRLVRFVTLGWLPGTSSTAGVGCALVASLLVVPMVLLAATDVVGGAPFTAQLVVTGLFAVVALAVCGILYALVLGQSRPTVMRHVAGWNAWDKLYWVALIVVVPTAGFACVTTFLIRHEVLSLAVADPAEAKLPFTVFGTYLRSLAGAMPLLDIPATLEWKPGLKFGAWEGNLLVLLYKFALIVPLLQLFSLLLKRLFAEAPAPAAEGK